jgi:hypothetical protein
MLNDFLELQNGFHSNRGVGKSVPYWLNSSKSQMIAAEATFFLA